MERILALDLGKFKSVFCLLDQASPDQLGLGEVKSTPAAVHDLIVAQGATRVVIEPGCHCGWVVDLCRQLGIQVQVANVNHPSWRWKNVSRKTDRDDAIRLAKMSASGDLPLVHVPTRPVREWRGLIGYRHSLVCRRTAIKNTIRALVTLHAKEQAPARKGWTLKARRELSGLSRSIDTCTADEDLWRGELDLELSQLESVEKAIDQVEARLDAVASLSKSVELLRTIDGVGPRLSEAVVAIVDDPHRFKTAKQVAAYAGLVPRRFQSGTMDRNGRITKRGNPLLRTLLVEVAWLMRQHNSHFKSIGERVAGPGKGRRKIAMVAVARRLLVTCWAMMRDQTPWRPPVARVPASPLPAG